MTRSESAAMALALLSWAALIPAFYGHFSPLLCWLTGWAFVIAMKPTDRGTK